MNVRHAKSLYGKTYSLRLSDVLQFLSDMFRGSESFGIQRFAQLKNIIDVFFGNEDYVPGINRVDVQKEKKVLVLPNLKSPRFFFDDAAKWALHNYNVAEILSGAKVWVGRKSTAG